MMLATYGDPEEGRLVVLKVCRELRPTLMASIGGFCETKVKALKGARLSTPERDRLVTHAIGRGTTMPVISR